MLGKKILNVLLIVVMLVSVVAAAEIILSNSTFTDLTDNQIKNYLKDSFSLDSFYIKKSEGIVIAKYKFNEVVPYGDDEVLIRPRPINTYFPLKHFTDCLVNYSSSVCFNQIINKKFDGYIYDNKVYHSTWMQAKDEAIRIYKQTIDYRNNLIAHQNIMDVLNNETPINDSPFD